MNGIGMHGDIDLIFVRSAESGDHPPAFDTVFLKMLDEDFGVAPAILAQHDRSL